MSPLLSFIIINYNTKNLLKGCINSILAQSSKGPIEVLFIDNNSHDGSVEFIKENYAADPRVTIIANRENIGYSGAGNQGIEMAKGEYIVITNPDIRYEESYFEHAISKMESDKKIAALVGKVLEYDFTTNQKTNIIDTVGLFIYKNRRVIDNGQGLEDRGQFDQEKEVFGVSGACPLYRRSALEDVKIGRYETNAGDGKDGGAGDDDKGEYLDNDFFMYKEDVDLSWRFQLFGWKCWYYPKAVAYHGRGTGVAQRFNTGQMLHEHTKMSPFQKKYGYINQRLMQIKNELPGNFWHNFFPIFTREIGTLAYITFREPYLWKSVWEIFKRIPRTLQKRREIMKRRRLGAREMAKWFQGQSEYYHLL